MYLDLDLVDKEIKKVDTVIAGPWVGEFGWELFCYQGYLRKLKYDNPHLKHFIIIGKEGYDYLYEDFATEYISVNIKGTECTGALCYDYKYDNIHTKVTSHYKLTNYIWIPTQTFIINYQMIGSPPYKKYLKTFKEKQLFISYEHKNILNNKKLILLHPRSTTKFNSGNRNWSKEKWQEIVYTLNNNNYVGLIGKSEAVYNLSGVEDYRDISLEELTKLFSTAKCVIGTSSGPLHLASLTNCPQVVIGEKGNDVRYKKDWNPFNTKVDVIYEEGWQPSLSLVIDRINNFLRNI